jgi:hypothetical protein
MDRVTRMIPRALGRRLDTLARRVGLSTTALGSLLLEAAVNDEERRLARDQRVARELEAILVRAILRGGYDGQAGAPRSRPPPHP